VGINLEHAFNDNNSIHIMAYGGNRNNLQILATNSGGTNARASQIARDFYGTDLRWDNKGAIFSKPYTLSFGVNYGESKDARLDTNVLSGGVSLSPPTLNRDEDNNSKNFDQYAQAKLAVFDNVDLHAGLRHTKVDLTVKDRALSLIGNNSGSVSYAKTTPVIGATWKVLPTLNLYANYGEGFETPTFIEAAYSLSAYVPNLTLKPSESKNYEVGAKAFIGDNTRVNLTLFKTDTENELVLDKTDGANRAIYTNANKTGRSGVEMSIDSQLSNNFGLYGAYTLLDAKFDSSYTNLNGGLIKAGNVIPGTYRTQLYGEASWKAPSLGFSTAIEGRYNSKVYVDDANTDVAPAYTIFNVRAGFQQNVNNWRFSEYLRVENMFDKDYIGSVRVNDGNARFFEPAAGRNYMVGVSASYRF
jgi:iron complex outermembrane receptor protein